MAKKENKQSKAKSKRNSILVTMPDWSMSVIKKELMGKMGDTHSEIVRNIIVAFLSGQGYYWNGGDNAEKVQKSG